MKKFRVPQEAGIFGVVLIVGAIMALLSPAFLTMNNMQVLLLNGTVVLFLAMGQTFVLLTGGIDLSVGSNIALTGMIAALAMQGGLPWWLAALLAIVTGALVGVFNGVFIHFGKMPAFIVTFATFGISASIPKILTQARSVTVADPMFAFFGRGSIFGIPIPVVLVLIAAVILAWFLHRTKTGLHIYAVGGNKETARLAGVNNGKIIILVYVISGICSGFGGIIVTSRLMVGYPTAGSGTEQFYSIASAVVGGVSLFGGVGTLLGAFLGAILIAEVSNGMNVIGVDSYWQPLVIGVIILVGVLLDTNRQQLSLSKLFRKTQQATSVASHASADTTNSEISHSQKQPAGVTGGKKSIQTDDRDNEV
ncbi:MAG: ABC transporter permease [Actinotignum sanguinis]|uniref:ABC transporter permease n=2 Tax=Actinomycetales TaxID=2037 RepID=UPI00237DC826|nr:MULTISPECIES: ABC transporter permease [Actinomycetaceae]MDE1552973.1 ABC transporter permease [Actinotignum sanguinis]MDE1565756.1 ABC transporter permease [Actinotignum sanguinis]MDE1577461.1 ABC transporter permease [Actinotignum sanguinis]MDE1642807.1 ABC transporter permease [Actinotignum sanguinis]MDK8319833.1 ABC transporter permease [Actinobaculum massiliense]